MNMWLFSFLFLHYLGPCRRQESWPSRLESSVCRLFKSINHDMLYTFFFWLSFAFAVRVSLSNWFFVNLAVKLFFFSSGSWNQSSGSSGGQWGREIEPILTIWSISSLVPFRDLGFNGLTELPPGIFDSLALLEDLYVLSLVAETSFVSPSTLAQWNASALWMSVSNWFSWIWPCNLFQLRELKSKL